MNLRVPHKPVKSGSTRRRLRPSHIALVLLIAVVSSCGLRAIPPLSHMPILGKEKQVTTTALLARALKDRDLKVRSNALELLGVLSRSNDKKMQKQVAQVLGKALKDRDPGIRLQAIEVLGEMESKFGNKYLLSALKDPNPFVRESVMQTLMAREKGGPAG